MTRKHLACSVFAAALSISAAHAKTAPTVTVTTVNAGGSSLAFPTYTADFAAYSASKSTSKASYLFSYEAVGSGAGQNAFLNNNINYFEPVSSTNPVGYAAGTLTYGTIVGTQVDIGASDAFLSASQLTNPATGSYAESSVDGPLIQLPTLGVPITLAFNESGVTSAGLTLTDPQICGVLSGKIHDWNTLVPSIPAGTTINVVYRTDGSGTTFLTTQHLNAVCTASNSSFPVLPVPITKNFVAASGGVFTTATLPANFTGASGSGGVSKALLAASGSFGYLSPDYTAIAPNSPNTTSLQVASVTNGVNGKTYAPTIANTTLGLAHPGTGSTNPTPPATLAAAENPLNWVPAIPVTTQGYPIVGYTTVDVSSCYANTTAGKTIIAILKDIYAKTGSYATITQNSGFVPLVNSGAAKFYTAVLDDFLTNTSGYKLDIDDATTCASYTGR